MSPSIIEGAVMVSWLGVMQVPWYNGGGAEYGGAKNLLWNNQQRDQTSTHYLRHSDQIYFALISVSSAFSYVFCISSDPLKKSCLLRRNSTISFSIVNENDQKCTLPKFVSANFFLKYRYLRGLRGRQDNNCRLHCRGACHPGLPRPPFHHRPAPAKSPPYTPP